MTIRKPDSVIALALLATAFLLTSLPAIGGTPPPPACGAPPLFTGAPNAAATPTATLAGPACTLAGSATVSSKPFTGFCRCSCTFIPDCNTSADCGGSACIRAVTCCAVGH